MVQVILGFGWPSTKHTKEMLVSDPAITFFTSSLRRTLGGAAGQGGGFCILGTIISNLLYIKTVLPLFYFTTFRKIKHTKNDHKSKDTTERQH